MYGKLLLTNCHKLLLNIIFAKEFAFLKLKFFLSNLNITTEDFTFGFGKNTFDETSNLIS